MGRVRLPSVMWAALRSASSCKVILAPSEPAWPRSTSLGSKVTLADTVGGGEWTSTTPENTVTMHSVDLSHTKTWAWQSGTGLHGLIKAVGVYSNVDWGETTSIIVKGNLSSYFPLLKFEWGSTRLISHLHINGGHFCPSIMKIFLPLFLPWINYSPFEAFPLPSPSSNQQLKRLRSSQN